MDTTPPAFIHVLRVTQLNEKGIYSACGVQQANRPLHLLDATSAVIGKEGKRFTGAGSQMRWFADMSGVYSARNLPTAFRPWHLAPVPTCAATFTISNSL